MTIDGRNTRHKMDRNVNRALGHFTEKVVFIRVGDRDTLGDKKVSEALVQFNDSEGTPLWALEGSEFTAQLLVKQDRIPDFVGTGSGGVNGSTDHVYVPRIDQYCAIVERHVGDGTDTLNIEPYFQNPLYAPIEEDVNNQG